MNTISNFFFFFYSFTRSAPLILSSLWSWLECEIFFNLVGRWIEWSSQWISGFEPVRDLLSFKPFECFSSSSKILETEFLQSLGLLKTWCSKWEGMPLFIVISEDKLHFEFICLKRCSRLLIDPNLLRDNYLYYLFW